MRTPRVPKRHNPLFLDSKPPSGSQTRGPLPCAVAGGSWPHGHRRFMNLRSARLAGLQNLPESLDDLDGPYGDNPSPDAARGQLSTT